MTLLRRKGRTVDELAQALDLTDNAIRAHLATLERDGVVRQRGARRGSGKPACVYDLAPEAEQLFPKAYGPVLEQLLEVLSEHMSSHAVEILLREVGRRIAGRWNVAPGDLPMRLEAAVEILNELGGMAALEECDGRYCIRGYSLSSQVWRSTISPMACLSGGFVGGVSAQLLFAPCTTSEDINYPPFQRTKPYPVALCFPSSQKELLELVTAQHCQMKFAGRYRLPGIVMGMSGERKVFTAFQMQEEAVNTFNIVFPMPQSFSFT